MAAFVKFNDFVEEVLKGTHDFSSDTFKMMLSNVAPNASTAALKADVTEIASGSGYAAGGFAITLALSRSAGTAKVTATDKVLTASGGAIATWRYAILYNDTAPGDNLVGYSDFGAAINQADGESFTFDFDATNGLFTLS